MVEDNGFTLNDDELVEPLAAYAHTAWSGWMSYMLPKLHIIASEVCIATQESYLDRWARQMQTPYDQLSEQEKESDRQEARLILAIVRGGEGRSHA